MIKKILNNNFTKNVILVFSGTAIAQIINIALSPVITRIYTAEEYGVLSVYIAMLSLATFIGSMSYELAIPIAKDDEEAINIFALSILTLTIFNIILLLLFILFGEWLLNILGNNVLIPYRILVPIGAFIVGLYNILAQWAYRRKNYRVISRTKVNKSLFLNMSTISFGLLGCKSLGLIAGRVLGESTGIGTLALTQIKEDRALLNKIKLEKIKYLFKRYIRFPIYTTPRRFLGDVSITLPVFFLTKFYGNEIVGFFSLAYTTVQLPVNLVGVSIGNVFYAECAALKNSKPNEIKIITKNLLKTLIIIGIIPFIVLVFWGPYIFEFIFGSQWHGAGEFGSILSIMVYFRLIFEPISNIFDIYEKQKILLLLNVIRVVTVCIIFGISFILGINSYYAITMFSISMAFLYLVQFYLSQLIVKSYNLI